MRCGRLWLGLIVVLAAPASAEADLRITTLSTLPDRVAGGQVLVRVDLPSSSLRDRVEVKVNGDDVTDAFAPTGGPALVGLVSGLRDGVNRIAAEGPGRGHEARLTVVNHPIAGPLFSGPHQVPFICETVQNGLGAPLDDDCSATTKVEYFYRSTETPTFKPLPDPAVRPADLAQTTTSDGVTVDYIVRVESGTINRHVYRTAILEDPRSPVDRPWSPAGRGPGPGWNEKLVYWFGGGCGIGHHQGTEQASIVLIDDLLSLGYAVTHATNNTAGMNCNDVLSAESALMVKQHFIETYGLPEYTTGFGASGGAFQQRLLAHNYPGILDGLILQLPFPDTSTLNHRGLDCSLLENFYAAEGPAWTLQKQAAVNGFAVDPRNGNTMCKNIHPSLGQNKVLATGATGGFNAVIPQALRYDPVTNPSGARATIWDNMVNVFGIDRSTGFARASFDNVGIQYGLKALNDGAISKQEFLDLNERIGGYSVDGEFAPARSRANRRAVELEYETGRVVTGDGLTVPMIEIRQYLDDQANVHDRVWTFAMKARMLRDKGHAGNLVAWVYPRNLDQSQFTRLALRGMDDWLTAIDGARPDGRKYEKTVLRKKPDSLGDGCWDPSGERIDEPAIYNAPSRCNTLFPTHLMPRMVAGGPLTNDVQKCALEPIDRRDYAVTFTSEERARLRAIFPDGVCDWSKPGVGRRAFRGPWQDFGGD
jgi:hypothetical protein